MRGKDGFTQLSATLRETAEQGTILHCKETGVKYMYILYFDLVLKVIYCNTMDWTIFQGALHCNPRLENLLLGKKPMLLPNDILVFSLLLCCELL